MGISKSKYVSYSICPGRLYYESHPENVDGEVSKADEHNMELGHDVGNMAKKYFPKTVEVPDNKDKTCMLVDTRAMLKDDDIDVIAEAAFAAKGCYCQVDLLRKYPDGSVDIIEVKATGRFKDYHYTDMAFQWYTVTSAGYKVNGVYGLHVNTSYLCEDDGTVNLNDFFMLDDATKDVIKRAENIEVYIEDAQKIANKEKFPEFKLGCHCHDPYACPYFAECTKDLPKNNIFTVAGLQFRTALKLYNLGIKSYYDILSRPGQVSPAQYNQVLSSIMAEDGLDGANINKKGIVEFLQSLTYPLYFLDFETFQQSVPTIPGTKAYEQVPSQYSLHFIRKKGGRMYHKEFLADEAEYGKDENGKRVFLKYKDPRRSIAEALVRDIPMNVCTLAYNMSFEKTVIRNLSKLFPDLAEHLMNIHDNMKDLMIPFQQKYYYDYRFNGKYSIKVVLPTLFPDDPSLDYHSLDIVQNGTMAQAAYLGLVNLNDGDRLYQRERLLRYCELDTYAMVKILYYLIQLVTGKEYNY